MKAKPLFILFSSVALLCSCSADAVPIKIESGSYSMSSTGMVLDHGKLAFVFGTYTKLTLISIKEREYELLEGQNAVKDMSTEGGYFRLSFVYNLNKSESLKTFTLTETEEPFANGVYNFDILMDTNKALSYDYSLSMQVMGEGWYRVIIDAVDSPTPAGCFLEFQNLI